MTPVEAANPMSPDDFDELDAILDDLRVNDAEVPQWEFCEGFMAALICCRRLIAPAESFSVLLGLGDEDGAKFADEAQAARFMGLWQRRWNEIAQALGNEAVENLGDEAAYHPEVLDMRGLIEALPTEERAALKDESIPSFAQVWALGFMYAVENWPAEWAPPRDKDAAAWLEAALASIVALTEDDGDPPELSPFSDDAAPTVSIARLNAFGDAIWAVYDLFELWRDIGPRVETVRKQAAPGRNDLCPCGSGKKYKKCCGAA